MNQTITSRASPDPAAPDLAAIKQRQQVTWASGDFAIIGVKLQIVGEALAHRHGQLDTGRVLTDSRELN